MGLFRPLIGKGLEIAPTSVEPSDRLVTPANAMTAARPIFALFAARMLLRGKHPVTPLVALMGASDAEGNVARLTDKFAPKSGLGTSKIGAEWDPIADTTSILIVSSAALFARRMPTVGRAAIATALGHEGYKAAWALKKNNTYQKITGERLVIPPTLEGKESMAEKFAAISLAVLASDFDNSRSRQAIAAGALTMAITGSLRAEQERRLYDITANEMIEDANDWEHIQESHRRILVSEPEYMPRAARN